jgi:hypothetical protein
MARSCRVFCFLPLGNLGVIAKAMTYRQPRPNNRSQRTPRSRCIFTSGQWRGAAAAERSAEPLNRMKSRIMYIEDKSGGLIGPARIGRVTFSKTGRTIYYRGRSFQSLKGLGLKPTTTTWRQGITSGFPARSATAVTRCTAAARPSKLTPTFVRSIGETSDDSQSERLHERNARTRVLL